MIKVIYMSLNHYDKGRYSGYYLTTKYLYIGEHPWVFNLHRGSQLVTVLLGG